MNDFNPERIAKLLANGDTVDRKYINVVNKHIIIANLINIQDNIKVVLKQLKES